MVRVQVCAAAPPAPGQLTPARTSNTTSRPRTPRAVSNPSAGSRSTIHHDNRRGARRAVYAAPSSALEAFAENQWSRAGMTTGGDLGWRQCSSTAGPPTPSAGGRATHRAPHRPAPPCPPRPRTPTLDGPQARQDRYPDTPQPHTRCFPHDQRPNCPYRRGGVGSRSTTGCGWHITGAMRPLCTGHWLSKLRDWFVRTSAPPRRLRPPADANTKIRWLSNFSAAAFRRPSPAPPRPPDN